MNARASSIAFRPRLNRRLTSRWASLFGGERVGRKKAWKCTFCGVIGSHRSGCHYVREPHHRGPKAVRRGVLGVRARAARRRARAG